MSDIHESTLSGQTADIAVASRCGEEEPQKIGVVYIAYGGNAQREALESIKSLRSVWPDPYVLAVGDEVAGATQQLAYTATDAGGRDAKTRLWDISPFQQTLYLDADTRVREDPRIGFDILDDGWDMVIVPSKCHGKEWLWHVGAMERVATQEAHSGRMLTLGGGVIWWARNERTEALWHAWHDEWGRWGSQDQGALMRAYIANPCHIWLLSRAWNSGICIEHRFGAARRR